MSIETNHQENSMEATEIEEILRHATDHRDTPFDMGYGFEFDPIRSIVRSIPASYTGEQEVVTINRPPVDPFMLNKPA